MLIYADATAGECYVELSSADDLSRALTLHRNCIGHRYVELFRTTRLEAMQVRRTYILKYRCVERYVLVFGM